MWRCSTSRAMTSPCSGEPAAVIDRAGGGGGEGVYRCSLTLYSRTLLVCEPRPSRACVCPGCLCLALFLLACHRCSCMHIPACVSPCACDQMSASCVVIVCSVAPPPQFVRVRAVQHCTAHTVPRCDGRHPVLGEAGLRDGDWHPPRRPEEGGGVSRADVPRHATAQVRRRSATEAGAAAACGGRPWRNENIPRNPGEPSLVPHFACVLLAVGGLFFVPARCTIACGSLLACHVMSCGGRCVCVMSFGGRGVCVSV